MFLSIIHSDKNDSPKERMTNILFVVRHNKSPNYVVYKVNLETHNKLNPAEPLEVFWFLKNKGEIIEDLTFIEWKLAYGFKLDEVKKSEEYKMELNAISEKEITVRKNARNKYLAYMLINGKMAKLKDVFFHYETTFGLPSVQYIDFKGLDTNTGLQVTERYIPE